MKKIIFYSMPGHGHTNPTVTVARELARRGHKVIYYSIEEFRERIEAAGLEYRSYDMQYYFDPILARNLGAFAKRLMKNTEFMVGDLVKKAREDNPDCIAYDSLSFFGKVVGKSLQKPSLTLYTTLAVNNAVGRQYPKLYLPVIAKALLTGRDSIEAYRNYLKICRMYGLTPDKSANFLLLKDSLNLVFTSSYFQPCAESFGKTFKFTGPSIYPRQENAEFLEKLDKNKKIIYLSMGTIFNDNLPFFQQCITLFGKTDYQVIIALGHRLSEKSLPKVPQNIIVRNYVPQLEVLQKADLFITHAGLNSISESLFYGVPMILLPQMYEQVFNAFRVQELGAGIYLKNQITPENILENVNKILNTKDYYVNAEKIRKTFEMAGGYKKAADEIVNYIDK